MNQFKRAQVVMLPTESIKNSIWLDNANYLLSNHFLIKQNPKGKFQHLYIISDNEIKEGDWFIHDGVMEEDSRTKLTIQKWFNNHSNNIYYLKDCKKIIATTDTSILLDFNKDGDGGYILYPQPSQQFIEKYIESYNKGEIITDVLVEYEEIKTGEGGSGYYFDHILKINPKDNTITIKKLKESWSREEVVKLLKLSYFIRPSGSSQHDDFCKFIQENL